MPLRMLPLAVILAVLTSIAPSTSAQSYIDVDPFDSSIVAIEKVFRETSDGSNHSILLALRQLRDPAMRPLFQRMLASKQPVLQIDALLALAEISNGSIDPFLLEQFAPRERALAIVAAIDLDLLDRTTIETILDSTNLTPVEVILLSAAGSRFGMPIDVERLTALLAEPDAATVTNAAMLLGSNGDTAPADRALERYAEMDSVGRGIVAAALADLASWHPMPAAVDLLRIVWQDEDLSRGIRLAAIDAAIGCDCEAGRELWRDSSKSTLNSGDRLRMGSMALTRGLLEDDWSSIRDNRKYNRTLADAGEALAAGNGVRSAGEALVAERNPILMEAAVALAEHAAATDAIAIRVAIINESLVDARLLPVASRSITDLANNSPQVLAPLLQQLVTEENPQVAQIALTGLLNSNNPEVWAWATLFEEHSDRTVRSIALLVEARRDSKMDKKKLEQLGVIASGGGRVDPTMRAIAAWLWLKKTGGQDRALARIVGEA